MKKLLAIVLLVCATAVGAQTNQHYTLIFYPTPSAYTGPTNIVVEVGWYYFTTSTNIALPLNQWTPFGATQASYTIPSSPNYIATTNFGNFIVMNPPMFFSGIVSNSSGVTPFSNQAGVLGAMSPGVFKTVTSP